MSRGSYAALQSGLQLRLRETGRLTIVWLAIIQLLPIRFFHVANKGLPTIVYMDMLDANKLLPASGDLSVADVSTMRRGSTIAREVTD